MKKYTLVLFALAFVFGLFNVSDNSASAANCASGDLFNTATGQACVTTNVSACNVGDLFSSVTGQRCPTGDGYAGISGGATVLGTFNNLLSGYQSNGGITATKALQQFLKDQGYYSGKIDGKYGAISARAVSDFQSDNNISTSYSGSNSPSTKTYSSQKYGFSLQYPTGTQITDVDISGGRNIIFTTSQGTVMVGVVTQAWNNGVLSSPPNCNDTASGADRTNTNINGVNFLTFSMSKEMSGMNSPTSATEYCAIRNGTAYKLITRVGYAQGSSNGLDLDKNPILNSMVASFKLN